MKLTAKELEVVRRLCEGLSNKEIGTTLGKNLETVKRQVSSAMDKTGSLNRVDLAMWAVRNLLFNPYSVREQKKEGQPIS